MIRGKTAELFDRHAMADQKHRHVTDDLAGGRDLDDVAEGHVDLGVGSRDLVPARARPMASACSFRLVYWPPGISCM